MLPIKDLNRTLSTPHMNRLLLITNIAVFTVCWLSSQNILLGDRLTGDFWGNFVMIPNEIVQGQRLHTLFTSMFMHAGWIHLLGNMLYLYIFGDNIEDIFGHVGYLVFYVACGLAASFAFILSIIFAPAISNLLGIALPADMLVGVVGASGAISGILGAYLILYPKAQILTLIFYVILPIPAILFLGVWFVVQWLYGVFDPSGGVAYYAHIGGFIAGMLLAAAFGLRRRKTLKTQLRL